MEVSLIFFDATNIDIDSFSKDPLLRKEDIDAANSINAELSKKEKLVSSYLKRKYIGDYQINKFGKPISKDKYFNISHSHGMVVLAVAPVEVGVDIELVMPKEKKMFSYISSPEEFEYIGNDLRRFYEIWTSKESLMKCIGTGVRTKMKDIPGLPINCEKEFNGSYYSKCIVINDEYICSITTKGNETFNITKSFYK